jgi:tetratricopeptide (TPR) repeat protein
MLPSVREAASETLASEDYANLALRHATYFMKFAVEAEGHFSQPDTAHWYSMLDADSHNLAAAWRWAFAAGKVEVGVRLCMAADWYWCTRGQTAERSAWREMALRMRSEMAPQLRASVLWRLAEFTQGATRQNLLNESMECYIEVGDAAGEGWVLARMAQEAFIAGDEEAAAAQTIRACDLVRSGGDDYGVAIIQANFAGVLRRSGRLAAAYDQLQECLVYHTRCGHSANIAKIQTALGAIAARTDRAAEALELLNESLRFWREIGDLYNTGQTLCELAMASASAGLHVQAAECLTEARALEAGFAGAGSISQWIAEGEEYCKSVRAASST